MSEADKPSNEIPYDESGHTLSAGVRRAEAKIADDIANQPTSDVINHGHYDIADHPIVTGERSLHQRALERAGQVGRAIVRYVGEADRTTGLQTWSPKQKDK
jgi:hypothetical protein